MQISVTISGLSRLFGDDLARAGGRRRVSPTSAGIDQIVMTDHLGDRPAHRPLPVRAEVPLRAPRSRGRSR